MRYTSKFRVSRFTRSVKSNILSWYKGDVPDYILNDVMDKLDEGRTDFTISMIIDETSDKAITEYLSEYHQTTKCWDLDFLYVAFAIVADRIKSKLSSYSDIHIYIYDTSPTDKSISIKLIKYGGEL